LLKRDLDIINSIRTGQDQKALNVLYKSLLPKIKKIIGLHTEAEEEAKDLFHDALLIFYKQVLNNKYDENYEVDGYIYSVAKNLWINKLRRNQKIEIIDPQEMPENEIYEATDEKIIDDEKNAVINNLFSMLDEKCSKLLTYTIYQDLSYEDIVIRMGFSSENAARTAHFRCKKYLMDLVKNNPQLSEMLRK
jgi:RNA polymerase sigma factor (sigma-70 family)